MLQIVLAAVTGILGYVVARNFVRNRLRFVDGIHSPWAPLTAGILAFAFAWPIALLPLVSVGPAMLFGLGTALGTAKGARLVRRTEGSRSRLRP